MECCRITTEQIETFAEDGVLVVRNAIDTPTRIRLLEAGDRLAASFLNQSEEKYLQERRELIQQDAFFDLVAHGPAVSLIIQLLGPNIHLQSAGMIYKHPEDPGTEPAARGWHRDIGITSDLGHDQLPLVGIKVCYCLTDFHGPNAGLTSVVPKSHKSGKPLPVHDGEFGPRNAKDLNLNAGDAFLFENRIYHSATRNLANRTSKVVIYGYAYRWMKPDLNLDIPDEALLEKAEPVARQLLGGYRSVETVPRALLDWAAAHDVCTERVPWVVDGASGEPVEIIPRY
jgi:ectoine hydroxylase-related dioxygenase (phytanoyl-CoA dioxygenase family)